MDLRIRISRAGQRLHPPGAGNGETIQLRCGLNAFTGDLEFTSGCPAPPTNKSVRAGSAPLATLCAKVKSPDCGVAIDFSYRTMIARAWSGCAHCLGARLQSVAG